MSRFFYLLCFALVLTCSAETEAAQSTADVPVTEAMKESLLVEILGPRVEQIRREDAYVIGHGDILSVSIFEEGDMSAAAPPPLSRQADASTPSGDSLRSAGSGIQVMLDGRISLRNIGDVEVVGLTLTQLADYLKQLYSSVYSDPIVTTTLVQSNSLRYTIMGQVGAPGVFFLDYPISISQTVARAGGFNEWAKRNITLIRKNVHERDQNLFNGNTLKFSYDDFVSGKNIENDIYIRPDDYLVVN